MPKERKFVVLRRTFAYTTRSIPDVQVRKAHKQRAGGKAAWFFAEKHGKRELIPREPQSPPYPSRADARTAAKAFEEGERPALGPSRRVRLAEKTPRGDLEALVHALAERLEGVARVVDRAVYAGRIPNPPTWVRDERIWEDAKAQIVPRWREYREPWAAVTALYERMGGRKL